MDRRLGSCGGEGALLTASKRICGLADCSGIRDQRPLLRSNRRPRHRGVAAIGFLMLAPEKAGRHW